MVYLNCSVASVISCSPPAKAKKKCVCLVQASYEYVPHSLSFRLSSRKVIYAAISPVKRLRFFLVVFPMLALRDRCGPLGDGDGREGAFICCPPRQRATVTPTRLQPTYLSSTGVLIRSVLGSWYWRMCDIWRSLQLLPMVSSVSRELHRRPSIKSLVNRLSEFGKKIRVI